MTIFAVVQITSNDDYKGNIEKAFKFIGLAAEKGAKVVALPETFAYIGNTNRENFQYKHDLSGELVNKLSAIAKEKNIYLIPGSIHEAIENENKMYNTSLLISPEGKILSVYRKIHLFDADFTGSEKYMESETFESGSTEQLTVTETLFGKFGITVCYDLRFPELYRKLTLKGAEIIFVPSAFTMHTGKDHWEILLRARAIENQVYILAPNQFGFHSKRRESYGNSMIIDPWGKVISRASDREEIIYADIDLEYVRTIRKKLPCLKHIKIKDS